MIPITLSEIGYAAGFYDGEGSIITMNNNRNIYVSITQKDQEPLMKLKKRFGGELNQYSGYWYLRLYGVEMRGFILTIFTLLSKRRRDQILKYKDHFNIPKIDACPNGHIYTKTSFRWEISRDRMYRSCKICRKINRRKYVANRKVA